MITVNSYRISIENIINIAQLLELLKPDKRFMAVVTNSCMIIKNGKVVLHDSINDEVIKDGDEIRIYPHLVGG